MSLLKRVKELFGTDNLYSVLGVEATATSSQLKKGYYKVSLKVHPDRADASDKEDATAKFQTLVEVYKVLSDKDRRTLYDEQGLVDEEQTESFDDAYKYWRCLFREVTIKDIDSFASKYRGSSEEKNDLKAAYMRSKGSMAKILTEVFCCSFDDEDRFRVIIDSWIAEGEVPDYPKYSCESEKAKRKRKRKAEKEAAEAEELLKARSKANHENSLEVAIQQRQAARANQLFSSLEEKYCQPKGKAKAGSSSKPKSKRPKQ